MEFVKSIDFSRLAPDHDHAISRRLLENLYFVSQLWMFNASEDQLRAMFARYIKQGAPGTIKRTPSKETNGSAAQQPHSEVVQPLLVRVSECVVFISLCFVTLVFDSLLLVMCVR